MMENLDEKGNGLGLPSKVTMKAFVVNHCQRLQWLLCLRMASSSFYVHEIVV